MVCTPQRALASPQPKPGRLGRPLTLFPALVLAPVPALAPVLAPMPVLPLLVAGLPSCQLPRCQVCARRCEWALATLTRDVCAESAVEVLNIFDVDDTLFNTPGFEEGRAEWERRTGKSWPHSGWFSHNESLRPPMVMLPAFALPVFRTARGQPGSMTVVLTGRQDAVRTALEALLAEEGLLTDLVIMKPGAGACFSSQNRARSRKLRSCSAAAGPTPDFKQRAVEDLLKLPQLSAVSVVNVRGIPPKTNTAHADR